MNKSKSQQRDLPDNDELLGWLLDRIQDWRQYRDDNYKSRWDEYYRLWRGVWDEQDKLRESERSRLISPALQQAVEATVAELEEATFGRDTWFDIEDDVQDKEKLDVEMLRAQLKEDLDYSKTKKKICEALLNGSLFGTGIGEIIVDEETQYTPEDRFIPGTEVMARGTTGKPRICVRLNPVSPYNFSSDPAISDIDDCLGCEITEVVPRHKIQRGIDDGTYKDIDLEEPEDKHTKLPGESHSVPMGDKVRLTRYYGQVPLDLLNDFNEVKKKDREKDEDMTLVEAIVVFVNDSQILKAEASPYMMQDRPVVVYQHDTVPGRLHGRGVCEKGYNGQKALDTELRARADALALTTHPMMAIDATRLPRGMKPKVQPGMTILTNGNPKEILMPLTFGQLNPVSYKESAELERMVTMGTGAMDMSALNMSAGQPQGQSMLLGASIKRQKRTLMNFQESFLIPFIRKAAFRFMQFDPERYPAKDLKFFPTSTMGLMAREFEQQQMTTMLGYIPPESPVSALVVKGIIGNSSLPNREDMLAALDQSIQQMQQNAQEDAGKQVQQAQLQVQADQNNIAREKMQFENQKFGAEFSLKERELMLDERKVAILEQAQEIEAAKLALQEMDIRNKHQADMANVAVKAQNNAQDNETNAENAFLQEMKQKSASHNKAINDTKKVVMQQMHETHQDLTKKVSEIADSVSKSADLGAMHKELMGTVGDLAKTLKTPKKRKLVKNADGSKSIIEE